MFTTFKANFSTVERMFLEHTDVFLLLLKKEKNKQQYTRFTFLLGSRDTDAIENWSAGKSCSFFGPLEIK
jgi:hypothetical protein